MFNVPVLLIIYNRVEPTHNVFQVLKQIQPTKLYVAADGAQPDEKVDFANCLRTRSVIIPNWNCDLHTLYKEEHYGKAGITISAINWFFEQEEEGIVLFEDTLPHPDFFPYCEELLNKYREIPEIVHIGGGSIQKNYAKRPASYYFSAYATFWGFATWKNRWQNFDLKMTELQDADVPKMLEDYFRHKKVKKYWTKWFKKKKLDLLEYQYNFHVWYRNGLCITPNVNLIANLSFKINKKRRIRKLLKKTMPILPIVHPNDIRRDYKADLYSFKKYYKRDFISVFADWVSINLLGNRS